MSVPMPTMLGADEWAGAESLLTRHILDKCQERLAGYRAVPGDVKEHANIERAAAQGGYGRRQIYELVQNAADALLGWPDGRIEVVLTANALYCANQGEPIDASGVDTILASHVSTKRGTEIGRFGLGFKSVLGVTNRPEFYSRSGSFRFNPIESEKLIRMITPDADRFPVLRLAEPLSAQQQRENDTILDELMTWAVTVVKLPLDRGRDWLAEDIRAFPAEFLLFSPHVGSLVMTDRSLVEEGWAFSQVNLKQRRIMLRVARRADDYDHVVLEEDGKSDEWKIFKTLHKPSRAAKEDGGELADRDQLPLMWAVPMRERNERTRFWAFFPTEQFTTLSGILNAPWKTNEDRQNVLNSRFNEELLRAAAHMVVEQLPQLVTPEDPGRYLELMPSLNDPPCWGDIELARHVYRELTQTACLLDADAHLRPPGDLRWHTRLPREAVEIWHSYPNRPANWMHGSFELQHRRARLEYIMRLAGNEATTFPAWLEDLVSDKSIEASAHALRAAAAAVKNDPKLREGVLTARILKTNYGSFVAPRPGMVFLSRDEADSADPRDAKSHALTLVHPNLAAREDVREALEVLGIKQVEATSQLEAMLERLVQLPASGLRSFNWGAFWNTLRGVPTEEAVTMLRERLGTPNYTRFWGRTKNGTFAPLGQALWPGPVVDGEELRDLGATIDDEFHGYDKSLLEIFGAVAAPKPNCGGGMDTYADAYRQDIVNWYLDDLTSETRPQVSYLEFAADTTTGPLDAFAALTHPQSKANFTHALLEHIVTEADWVMRHKTVRDRYPSREFMPPSRWLALFHGLLHTSRGPRETGDCFAPELERWSAVLPVARISSPAAQSLLLTKSLDELDAKALFALVPRVHETCRDTRLLSEFYAVLIEKGVTLDEILCRKGDEWQLQAPKDVYVETDPDRVRILIGYKQKGPHLYATPTQATLLMDKWKLRRTGFQFEIKSVPSDEPTPLLDRFPQLWSVEEPEAAKMLAALELVPCRELSEETITLSGRDTAPHSFLRRSNTLYFLDTLSRAELFERVLSELDLPLSPQQREELHDSARDVDGNERCLRVRQAAELPDKLLLAVGHAALKRHLPRGLLKIEEDLRGAPTPRRFAEMALAVYGVQVLHEFRDELAKNGLNPPAQWAGRHEARRFVSTLGFSAEYAGFEQSRRAPVEEVEGPPNLPQAHDYQIAMMVAVRELPLRRVGSQRATRGLLSLPTGAGKTRVSVEALVQAIREDGLTHADGRRGPIVWIAQSDELCEQAVVTWRYVWRAVGPSRRLVISRLWGANEADAAPEGVAQVVVATIDKVRGCLDDDAYKWLSRPSFVVVDEAHGATGQEYTALFEWLGLSWRDQNAGRDRCPVLGLTATAFRGNEEETVRLVKRFGGYRLDFEEWKGNPYPYLQKLGVLARVKHELLSGRQDFKLDESELADLRRLRRLPASAESRLGSDTARNMVLLKRVQELPDDWPILMFATSVEHAETMAALLSLEGISSAAISGQTPPAVRRHIIEQFRSGKIRVLTNCNVLTAGFDAPSVRCVFVARPVYSAGLYQQMIGRGLRGIKNGGKEECLIINVQDTFAEFREAPAFTQFEYLWNPEVAAQYAEATEEAVEAVAEEFAAPDEPEDVADSNGHAEPSPLENPKVSRAIVIVRGYGDELKRRWKHLAAPMEESVQARVIVLENLVAAHGPKDEVLRTWEEESFKALQSRARLSGIKDSQLPMPSRSPKSR